MAVQIAQAVLFSLLFWSLVLSSEQEKIENALVEIKMQLETYTLGNAFSDVAILDMLKTHDYDLEETVESLIKSLENDIHKQTESAGFQSGEETYKTENDANSMQSKIADIDKMPSLRNTAEITNKRKRTDHDGDEICNVLENQENASKVREKKTEEQFEYERAGNESKNFAVGEIVLINGLTKGPEPLPNGKLADIGKGPTYKKNQDTQIIQERYEISIESKIKASMPSEFLHKISRQDVEQVWKQKLLTASSQEFGWDPAILGDLVGQLKLTAYQNYEDAQMSLFLLKQFSSDDVIGALEANNYYPLQTFRYLSSKKECNQSMIPSPGMYSVVRNLIRVTDRLNLDEGETIKKLNKGDDVEVIELVEVPEDKRIRGRIEGGWISITDTSNGKWFAQPKYFEDWRQKLMAEFGPSLQCSGWNAADIESITEFFGDKNFTYYSYETAKSIFGDLCSQLFVSEPRLLSALKEISQIVDEEVFLSFPIRTAIIKNNYNVNDAVEVLCVLQKRIKKQSSALGIGCDQSQLTTQRILADSYDIGEKLQPGSIYRLVNDHEDNQSNVLNPQPLARNENCMGSSSGVERLLLAAQTGDQCSLTMITEEGVDVNSRNASGRSALHLAAIGGHDYCLELLLIFQADLFALDAAGQSIISEYIRAITENLGSMSGLRTLVEYGAQPSNADLELLEKSAGRESASNLVKEAAKYLKQVEFQNKKI